MTLVITKADEFTADFARYFAEYLQDVDENVAWRFQSATETALDRIARLPELGVLRRFRNPMLHELRSFRTEPPFDRIFIFYRVCGGTLEAWRLIHCPRNPSWRLLEPPSAD
jgi:hypothetical protein